MAFMVPVVKKDYDIYSKSPPKNKPIVKLNNTNQNTNNTNNSNQKVLGRQQSNSITFGLLQHKQQRQKNPQRIHSKSVNETQVSRNARHRSTSNSSTSDSSSESLEIMRKMMHFMSFDSNPKTNSNNTDDTNQRESKIHWTAKIFKKRKNSLNSHKIS